MEKDDEVKKDIKIEIKGIDIDKAEYEEIILSNSNHPNRGYNDEFQSY